jgi:hypothetical protein
MKITRATATSTPRASPTSTRTTPTRTATPAYSASIGGRLTTTYTLPGKSASQTAPLPHALVIVSLGGINTNNAASGEAVIQVDLRSMNPAKLSTPNFEIFYQDQAKPISLKATCPVSQGGAPMTCNIYLAKTTLQDTGGVPKERLIAIGLVYAFADRADAMQKKLEKSFSMFQWLCGCFIRAMMINRHGGDPPMPLAAVWSDQSIFLRKSSAPFPRTRRFHQRCRTSLATSSWQTGTATDCQITPAIKAMPVFATTLLPPMPGWKGLPRFLPAWSGGITLIRTSIGTCRMGTRSSTSKQIIRR